MAKLRMAIGQAQVVVRGGGPKQPITLARMVPRRVPNKKRKGVKAIKEAV